MSTELLQDLIDAGWDVTVRRSPATSKRPHGKVLRWHLNLPAGHPGAIETRTGPQLLDALHAWCAAAMPEALKDDSPVPVLHQPAPDPEQVATRAFPGHRGKAGTAARVAVGYDAVAAFPALAAVRDAAAAWRGADDAGAAAASDRLSAAIVEVYNADVPLTAIGAVAGMHAASARNRAIRYMRNHGITDTRTGAASGPRQHARKPVPA